MNENKRQSGVTLEKAREILGEDFVSLSDTELQDIVEELYFLAHISIDNI